MGDTLPTHQKSGVALLLFFQLKSLIENREQLQGLFADFKAGIVYSVEENAQTGL